MPWPPRDPSGRCASARERSFPGASCRAPALGGGAPLCPPPCRLAGFRVRDRTGGPGIATGGPPCRSGPPGFGRAGHGRPHGFALSPGACLLVFPPHRRAGRSGPLGRRSPRAGGPVAGRGGRWRTAGQPAASEGPGGAVGTGAPVADGPALPGPGRPWVLRDPTPYRPPHKYHRPRRQSGRPRSGRRICPEDLRQGIRIN